ncbi:MULTISPECIES: nucleotidyltransferase [Emticicia]|uniref:nucleotidyltransferase domain-containing protein n=1 Tax=Emticicia TaxID=312278 RepID=UPI0007D8C903|nr:MULTISPECIES: nucleotidyltransferase [Emticicia]
MLTIEQKKQFDEIFEELVNNLDITESQYKAAVSSYNAVGNWLSSKDCILSKYNPEILPQGSFLIGTMIKPMNDEDDLDIDLVCELTGKNIDWTQEDLKTIVGNRIKENETYKEMLADEGRRCWTLEYRNDSEQVKERYHMDILPAIINEGYNVILEKAFSETNEMDLESLSIRITDNETDNYKSETDISEWMKSNPFGYGKWFINRATLSLRKAFSLNESIKPVPTYQKEKLPLQRVVQILKRHRDKMFLGDEDKPISIIITTLAGKAYNKETDLFSALSNVISNMESHIDEKYDFELQKRIKFISNPINEEENFADKWVDYPKREENFFKWLRKLQSDFKNILNQTNGLQFINESMKEPFGESLITKTFSNYGERLKGEREKGNLKVASLTGTIGTIGATIKNHNFYGFEEEK